METNEKKPQPVQILTEIGTSMLAVSEKVPTDLRFLGHFRSTNKV